MTPRRVARVLIDSPLPQLDRLFDYAVPDALADEAQPGVRVKVPLRSAGRMVDGFIVEIGDPDASDRPLSEIDAVVSPVPVLTPGLYALARRAADRAAGSASDILRLAIPKRMVRAEKAWLAAPPATAPDGRRRRARVGRRSARPVPGARRCDRPRRAARGRRAARAAAPLEDGATVGAWAVLLAAAAVADAGRGPVRDPRGARSPRPWRSSRRRSQGGSRPGASVRDDSRQSSPLRYAAFLRTLAPAPCIVIGNRSAVYAPVHQPGLIAIWDDGDPLLAEPLSPGVHARDAALLRQELDGSALLFAGHTRTTDVERLVAVGWVREVRSARRASPRVVLSATREGESRGARVPSAAFAAAREALAHGPVLVQVARPGYAPVLVCAECRHPARCPHCGGPLRAARSGRSSRVRVVRTRGARLDLPRLLLDPAAHGVGGQRAHRRRARPRVSRHPRDRRRRRAPGHARRCASGARRRDTRRRADRGGRVPRGHPARRRPDAARRRSAHRGVVPALVVERRRARRPRRAGAPGGRRRTRGPRARHLDAAGLRPRRARRSRPRCGCRRPSGSPRSRATRAAWQPRWMRCATRCPTLDDDAVLGPLDRRRHASRALVRFDYALGPGSTDTLRASVVVSARALQDAAARDEGHGRPRRTAQYTQSPGRPARPRPVRNPCASSSPARPTPPCRRCAGSRRPGTRSPPSSPAATLRSVASAC